MQTSRTTAAPLISRVEADRLGESRETSAEIFLAISAVLKTADETAIWQEWEDGYRAAEVVALARELRLHPSDSVFWGEKGEVGKPDAQTATPPPEGRGR